ncbi:MAG TPA: toll/interleukin-1 receptor domain-containing protein, partial [Thermoanaerobaculia bacterium]|nr:toll/interleukin-1 receptor domain-containing protein [Thermoanaerobaculia bacterium]
QEPLVITPSLVLPASFLGGERAATDKGVVATVDEIYKGPTVYETYKWRTFDVMPGVPRSRVLTLRELTWRESLTKLWFRQRDYTLRVKLSAETDNGEVVTTEQIMSVKPKGPVTGVIIGAILGVVAIVLFSLFYRANQKHRPPTREDLVEALVTVALGWTTVIVIALGLRFANLAVPLLPGAGANDFRSGGVLGLFVQPLIVWLAKYVPLPGDAERSRHLAVTLIARPSSEAEQFKNRDMRAPSSIAQHSSTEYEPVESRAESAHSPVSGHLSHGGTHILPRTSVFISYSHRDEQWLQRVLIHLRPLARETGLEIWSDRRIEAGSQWREEITNAIASAKAMILIISADFLASDFIATDELPPLLEASRNEGAIILPLIVSPSRFSHTPQLSRFQAVNDPSRPVSALPEFEREEVFVRLATRVEQVLAAVSNEPARESPRDRPL